MSDFKRRKSCSLTSICDALKLSEKCVESPMIFTHMEFSIPFWLSWRLTNVLKSIRHPQTRKLINKLEITAYNVWVQFYRYLFGNLDFSSVSTLIISATLTLFVVISREAGFRNHRSWFRELTATQCVSVDGNPSSTNVTRKCRLGRMLWVPKRRKYYDTQWEKKNVTACDLYKSK